VATTGEVAAKAHVDWLPRIEFELDHPVGEVWPHIVVWDSWMDDKVAEHVSGPKDAVGETKRVGTLKDGQEVNHFFCEVVRVEPEKRLAYRLLPLREPLDEVDSARGHLIFTLFALPENRTLVVYETVGEMESSTLDQDQMTAQYAAAEAAGAPHWLEHYVPELERRLKEGS
jgi:uncharacterized protein YndB with AHSA1/START domain